jgi:hypothetical protein
MGNGGKWLQKEHIGRRNSQKQGSLMLATMVAIAVVTLASARLAPSFTVANLRMDEGRLRSELAGFREAIDLERLCGYLSPCQDEYASLTVDPGNREYLLDYLKLLEQRSFLRNREVIDALIPTLNWGTAPGQLFWTPRLNLLQPLNASFSQSSFEAGWLYDPDVGTLSAPGWKNALDPTKAVATLSEDHPSDRDPAVDDYAGQNKTGRLLQGKGYSLRLEKIP